MVKSDFQENDYLSLCSIHVRNMLLLLSTIKTSALMLFVLVYFAINTQQTVNILTATFVFFVVSIINLLLLTGVKLRRYIFIVPCFIFCVISVFILILHLFVEFLNIANAKDGIDHNTMFYQVLLLISIVFEIYMLFIGWRTFQYICDYNMNKYMMSIEHKKMLSKKSIDVEYELIRNRIIDNI